METDFNKSIIIEKIDPMIERGARYDADVYEETVLHKMYMSSANIIEMEIKRSSVEYINKRDKLCGNTALHNVMEYPYGFKSMSHIYDLLINHGADINIKNYYGELPIHNVMIFNEDKTVELLKKMLTNDDWIGNINSQTNGGFTPLHYAIYRGNIEKVELLLSHGAYVNLQDEYGNTPLHYAMIRSNTPQLIEMLLNYGAMPDIQNKIGNTPMHFATMFNVKLEVIEMILKHKHDVNHICDVNLQNIHGNTPLHFAIFHNNENIVRVLLSSKANFDMKNLANISPLDLARKNNYESIVWLFEIIQNYKKS